MNPSQLETWLSDYKRSWEELDTELLVSLFTLDAAYYPNPFWIPFKGSSELRMLWNSLKGHQSKNHIELASLSLSGSNAVIRWQGYSSPPDGGATRRGDGIFLLTFDAQGRCSELLEWQHWQADDQPRPSFADRKTARTD